MIKIREFVPEDQEEIKRIFRIGIRQQIKPAFFNHLFWKPSYIGHLLYVVLFYFMLNISLVYLISIYCIFFSFIIWYLNQQFDDYINHSLEDDLLDIGKYYNQKDAFMWVALDESNKIVGHIALDAHAWRRAQESKDTNSTDYNQYSERITELRRCSVSTECRNRGIGRLLVNHLIKHAKEKLNAKCVFLTTTSVQRPAIKLYQKCGFKIVGYVDQILANIMIVKMEIYL